jgi:hypothetical protein
MSENPANVVHAKISRVEIPGVFIPIKMGNIRLVPKDEAGDPINHVDMTDSIPEIFFNPINLWNFGLIPKSEAEIYNKRAALLFNAEMTYEQKRLLFEQLEKELFRLPTGKLWEARLQADHIPIWGIPLEKCRPD